MDYLIIGKFLGAQDLGYYTLGYRILLYPLQTISSVISKVMFPYYTRIRDDNMRFRKTYLKVSASIAIISFPMMLGLWAVADDAVYVLLGENWAPVTSLILILAPLGMLQSVGTMVGNIYTAKGRTGAMFYWSLVSTTLVIVGFLIGKYWGINGVAVAYLMVSLALMLPGYVIPFRYIELSVIKYFRNLEKVFLFSVTMCLSVCLLQMFLSRIVGSIPKLLTSICLGATIYTLLLRLFHWPFVREVWSNMLSNKKLTY